LRMKRSSNGVESGDPSGKRVVLRTESGPDAVAAPVAGVRPTVEEKGAADESETSRTEKSPTGMIDDVFQSKAHAFIEEYEKEGILLMSAIGHDADVN